MQAVPIINENDSVSSSEIRFGDNDSLSAIVAGMVSCYTFLLLKEDVLTCCGIMIGSCRPSLSLDRC